MRQYDLVEKVLSYNPKANEALLNRAYVYAMKAHGQQKRASGDPYFSHPLEVASILTGLKLDDETIATALLHDTIEDTQTTKDEIERLFGPNIAALVDGLTKIEKLNLVSKKTQQAENFRKLLIAISSDVRVLLVKLADRLHNMRTLEHMRPEKRRLIAQETMDIYAPLAGRMGIQEIRDELEELSFRWLHPAAYETLMSRLNVLRDQNRGLTGEIATELKAKLEAQNIKAEVFSREKKPYSIWLKMQNKQIGLEQLSDVYGFRVIVSRLWRIATPRSASCTRRGAWCPAASRTTSRRRSITSTSRSTPPSSARATSASSCRCARRKCIRSPNMALRRTPATSSRRSPS